MSNELQINNFNWVITYRLSLFAFRTVRETMLHKFVVQSINSIQTALHSFLTLIYYKIKLKLICKLITICSMPTYMHYMQIHDAL